jgi:hypothetical protein
MNSLLLVAMFLGYLFLATAVWLAWLFRRAELERQKTELDEIQARWDQARQDRL